MYTTNRNIQDLQEITQKACNLFLNECKKNNLNVAITETVRTQERQNYLYCQGRTATTCINAGITPEFAYQHANPTANKVTWTLNSNHKNGYAWDIHENVTGTNGEQWANTEFFYTCGQIAQKLGITWGGLWTTQDLCHFQIDTNWIEEPETDPEPDPEPETDLISNPLPISHNELIPLSLNINDNLITVQAININGYNLIPLQTLNYIQNIILTYENNMPHIKSIPTNK